MAYIPIDKLKIGQSFSQPVYIEDDMLFVSAGVPILEKDIKRLHKWQVEGVETEGVLLENIAPEPIWGLSDTNKNYEFYKKNIYLMDGIFSRIINLEKVNVEDLEVLASNLFTMLEKNTMDTVSLIITSSSYYQSLAKNAVDTGLLAMLLGLALTFSQKKLLLLCHGALLQDIGMQRLPQNLMHLKKRLAPEEIKIINTHPLYSYRIIKEELQFNDIIAQMALEHHEWWDGNGYPQQHKKEDILLEARILSVSSAFGAMISERSWRSPMISYDAIKAILSDSQRRFDPDIVKILIKTLGLYPPGSLVQLSDNSIARILHANDQAPLRPKIVILLGPGGQTYKNNEGPNIDLRKEKKIFIVKALDIKSAAKKISPA